MKQIEKVKKQKEQGLLLVEKQVMALIPKIKPEQIAGLNPEDIPSSYEDLPAFNHLYGAIAELS